MGKHRISISEQTSIGSSYLSPINADCIEDFLSYLHAEKVKTFNLKYRSIMDDMADFHELGLSIDKFDLEHFNWLIEKINGKAGHLKL